MKQVLSPFSSYLCTVMSAVTEAASRISRNVVFAIFACAMVSLSAHAQTTNWIWMNGSNVITNHDNGEYGQPGVYGVQGQPSPANVPGGRLGAVSWTDANGNFWLFGGAGLDSAETFGFLNDLWEYDPSTGEWTWVSGSDTIPAFNGGQPGVYGQQGTPAATNTPGARSGALGWTDPAGNLWLFGGAGFDAADSNGNLNDLWKFSPSTREWTWVAGNSNLDANGTVAGVYGTPGSLTAGSFPGSRNNGVTWTDNDGSLWLFGGYGGSTVGQFGDLNDLWKYVPSTNQWAWMGGSSTSFQLGVYGQLGTPAPGNVPGARDTSAAWVDNDGNFWLFGGNGYVQVGSTETNGDLNDLWKFNPTTTEWAWMGGSSTLGSGCADLFANCIGSPGVYGILGTAAAGNLPGGRASTITWKGQDGALWLLGGNGSDANGTSGILNDFWRFDPAANEWTWMGGSSTLGGSNAIAGVYGTLGIPSAGNFPGGRMDGVAWTDIDGNFWLFGGDGSDAQGRIAYLNDLWVQRPVTATPTLSLAAGSYTTAQTVTISDATAGASIYYTTDGSIPTTASNQYTAPFTVSSTQTINAIANATNHVSSAVASAMYTIQLTASMPVFSPAAGTYAAPQMVTISDSTPGASIYYTTDGTIPTASSAKYSGPITVASPETINAIASAANYVSSAVVSAAYVVQVPASAPVFSPAAGTYTTAQTVTISEATPGGSIYYTTDGSAPSASSKKYTGPVTVSSTETINAIATAASFISSAVASATYTIQPSPSFTFADSPTSLAVASGSQATVMLTVIPQNGFNSTVSFACTGLQPGVTCTFSPATVTPSGAAAITTQLTVSAGTETSALRWNLRTLMPAAPLALAIGLFWPGKRRKAWLGLLLVMAFAGAGMLTACGSGTSTRNSASTVPAISTITVEATSGSIQQSTIVTLTVN